MKKRVFVALALALIWIALPVMVALAGNIFHFRGKSADAFFFSSTGPPGCTTETFVGVFANDGRFQSPPGPGSRSSGASIFIDQGTVCPDFSPLISASGFAPLADPDFQVFGKLNSATLNATIPVFDFVSGLSFDVDVNLTWAGTGGLSSGKFHSHFKSPDCIINSRFTGTFRSAEASGSVSAGGTNFTPNPSVGAAIQSAKNGEVQIGCEF